MTETSQVTDSGILDVTKRIAEGSIVLGALLFVGGWSYLYGYYRSFGLSLGDIDFSSEVTLVFAFPVIFNWRVLLVLIIAALVYKFLSTRVTRLQVPRSVALIVLFAIVARLVSSLGGQAGETKAHRDMVNETSSLPVVKTLNIAAESKDTTNPCLETQGDKPPQLRLLLHTRESYFLFEPPFLTVNDKVKRKDMYLCSIPQERVRSILLDVRAEEE